MIIPYKPLILGSLLLLLGMGCSLALNQQTAPTASGNTTARIAPAFSLEDYNGAIVSLTDFEGQPLIINSWAAWCTFCRNELPDFVTLQKEFEDISIIVINRQETKATAIRYSEELGVIEDLIMLLDPRDTFYRSIAGFSMPETIFVSAEGTIQFHKRGVMTIEEMRERTQTLLE